MINCLTQRAQTRAQNMADYAIQHGASMATIQQGDRGLEVHLLIPTLEVIEGRFEPLYRSETVSTWGGVRAALAVDIGLPELL